MPCKWKYIQELGKKYWCLDSYYYWNQWEGKKLTLLTITYIGKVKRPHVYISAVPDLCAVTVFIFSKNRLSNLSYPVLVSLLKGLQLKGTYTWIRETWRKRSLNSTVCSAICVYIYLALCIFTLLLLDALQFFCILSVCEKN